jgi:type IV pilus assembly protein PilB
VGKYNIDDILNELGVDDTGEGPRRAPPESKKHTVDRAERPLAPLPSVPANQRTFGVQAPTAPAPSRVAGSSAPSVGPAVAEIYTPGANSEKSAELGELLLSRGVVTPDKLAAAQQVVRSSPGRRLSDILMEQGVDSTAVQRALAELAGVPFERIDFEKGLDGGFDGKMLQRLTPAFCKERQVIPLRMEGSRLVVATTSSDNPFLLDEVRARAGVPVKFVLTTADDIKGALEIIGDSHNQEQVDVSEILAEVQEGDVQVDTTRSEEVDLEKVAEEGPVIRYVNHIIQMAIQQGASDIHIEPSEKKIKVRFRIDGELYEALNPPASMAAAITSRLKIMAGLAIDQRRIPQDGRIRCTVQGRKIDLRVSTLPAVGGEKTVMRILNDRSISVDLDDLGFDPDTLTIWKKQIESPHGIILVTGPTGSGKTTTLYASLRQLDRNAMNISTVEDPVEYTLEGITQTQVHEKAGMTFAVALKALLRQDPDVIMLGEIRDHETAITAVQAALTGHLVLSTLHTNDAPSSITRLVNIGLEPFLVGAAVNAVLAQRLLRRLCVHCKAEERPTAEMSEFLTLHGLHAERMWAARGCDRCRRTGYSGRVGIYELLVVDDHLRDLIARNPNVAEFRRTCMERGMQTLRADGMRKVSQGVTTVGEVLRVTEAVH